MSLLCQVCMKNFISAMKTPYGGFICAQEHFQCSECNSHGGKCRLCGGNTQFLQFTVVKGENDLSDTNPATQKEGDNEDMGNSLKTDLVFNNEDDLVQVCQTLSVSECGTETAFSENGADSKPIITLLPVMRVRDNFEQGSETLNMSSKFLRESYLRDFDGRTHHKDIESINSNHNSAVVLQQQTIKQEVQSISESGLENIVQKQQFAIKFLPKHKKNESSGAKTVSLQSTENTTLHSAKHLQGAGTSTDVITTTVSNSEVIYLTQFNQTSATQMTNETISHSSNEQNNVLSNEKVLTGGSAFLSQQNQNLPLADSMSRKTVPIILLPLDELLKEGKLSQNLAFQTALLALREQDRSAQINEQLDWSSFLQKAERSNQIQTQNIQPFAAAPQQLAQLNSNKLAFEAKIDPANNNQLLLTTHIKDIPLNAPQGFTVLTTTFKLEQQAENTEDNSGQQQQQAIEKAPEKILKDVGTTISRPFISLVSIDPSPATSLVTVMEADKEKKNLDLTKEETDATKPPIPLHKKYLIMHASESMPAALASHVRSKKGKNLADEFYRKLMETFQEDGKVYNSPSGATIIKEPDFHAEKEESKIEKEEKVMPQDEIQKPVVAKKTEKSHHAQKAPNAEKFHRGEKKSHQKAAKKKHTLGEPIVEQPLPIAEPIQKDAVQKEPPKLEMSRAVPPRVHPISSRNFERLASIHLMGEQKTVNAMADMFSEPMTALMEEDLRETEEVIPKGVPDAHTVLLNRAPIRCPESDCNHSLFVSDFCQHLVFDHNNVPLERILPEHEKIFFCDVRSLRRNINRCIMCYFVRNAVKNIGTTDFKDYLPVMIMATRTRRREICELNFKKRQDDMNSDFFFFWVTGLVPEKRPVRYELTIWPLYTDSSDLHLGYKNHVYSLRNKQEPYEIWSQGSGVLLYPSEVRKLTNDFKDVMVLKITVH